MHVLPIVTRAPARTSTILCISRVWMRQSSKVTHLRGVQSQVPQGQQRITYRINLFASELHIFVRPELGSLQDLVGKKVSTSIPQADCSVLFRPPDLQPLRLELEKMFIPHPLALEQMRRGAIAGVVFVTSKPVNAEGRWKPGSSFCQSNWLQVNSGGGDVDGTI
jgi:hypothetical protein